MFIRPLPATRKDPASSSHRRAGRRIHRAGARGAATLPRAVPRNFPRPAAPWSSAAERPRRSFGESPASRTEEQRGEFSAPKAFVPSPRGSAERSAPRNFLESAAERPRRSFGESPASCTEEQRGEFSAPKAFVLHAALTSSRRAAARARSTNFAKASRPRKNLPSLSHNHFGERRGAGSESFGTDTCGTDASGAVALFSAAP